MTAMPRTAVPVEVTARCRGGEGRRQRIQLTAGDCRLLRLMAAIARPPSGRRGQQLVPCAGAGSPCAIHAEDARRRRRGQPARPADSSRQLQGDHTRAGGGGLAIARGAGALTAVEVCPLADGRRGDARILLAALGGEILSRPAHDALGRPVDAELGLLAAGEMAVVEVAGASGLALLDPAELDAGERPAHRHGGAAGRGGRDRRPRGPAGGGRLGDHGRRRRCDRGTRRAGGLHGATADRPRRRQHPFERAAEVFAPRRERTPPPWRACPRALTPTRRNFRATRGPADDRRRRGLWLGDCGRHTARGWPRRTMDP